MYSNAHPQRESFPLATVVLMALAFVVIPVYELAITGPFNWHIRQPRVWQGGMEAITLAVLVASGFATRLMWLRAALIVVPSTLFLRRHAADVPFLIDLAYFEILVGLGMCLRRLAGIRQIITGMDYLYAFSSGIVTWSILAWALSLFKHGAIVELRYLTVALIPVAIYGRTSPLCLYIWRGVNRSSPSSRIWAGVLASWILILFARSKVVFGYDSVWYGLRGEYVLDPAGSLFEPLNLVSPVYYFPKLYEVLLLPVSDLQDFSVIQGITILLVLPVLLACRQIMNHISAPRWVVYPSLALVATLPAFANNLLGSKPDVMAVFFILMAAISALQLVAEKSRAAACWLATFSMLSVMSKLVAIPYSVILLLTTAGALYFTRRQSSAGALSGNSARLAHFSFGAAMLLGALVFGRTFILTGMPTVGPEPLVHLWTWAGLTFNEPTGTIGWMFPVRWSGVWEVVLDVLFRPQHEMPHMIVNWIGNVWLWLAVVAVIFRSADARLNVVNVMPLIALILGAGYLYFGIGYSERGSDGNYFLYGVLPAIILSATVASQAVGGRKWTAKVVIACVSLFVLFQVSYSFVSASWSAGTRAFDTDFARDWRGAETVRKHILATNGLADIAKYLSTAPGSRHVVGSTIETAGNWLPARYESIEQISYARPEYLSDAASFRRFLARFDVKYVVGISTAEETKGNKNTAVTPSSVLQATKELQGLHGVKRVEDKRHYLIDLSALSDAQIESAVDARTDELPASER